MVSGIRVVPGHVGYNVLPAESPNKAIRLAKENPGKIQLILTDVIMPKMNGRELSETLTSIQPGLKSLYMSGYTADVISKHGVLEEEVLFLQKPCSLQDLSSKIHVALERTD